MVNLLHSLGNAHAALNENKKAVEVFEKALKIVEKFAHPFYEIYRRHCLWFLSEAYTVK